MKTLFLSTLVVLAFAFCSFSQQPEPTSEKLTITELVAYQKAGSEALRRKQESEFRLLLDAQKSQMEYMVGGRGGNANDLSKLFANERAAVQKHYTEERSKLAELQKSERAELLKPKPRLP